MSIPSLIFYSVFGFSWLTFIWEFYLSFRQYRKYRDTLKRPDDLVDVIDEDSFNKSRAYKLDRSKFGFASSIWGQLQDTVVLVAGLIPIFWNISGHIIGSMNLSHEIWQSLVFLFLTTIASKLLNLPFKLYDLFVVEEKHGFNKQTLGFFIKDQVKGLVIGLLIGAPIMAAVIWIIQWGGDYFFIFVWIFLSVVLFVLMTVYPEFIAPLFDKYEPLPDGELKTKIEALASRLNFPLKKLFVVEGSKRSAHSNAYLYGLWNNKRIVLYDTILENYSPVQREKETKKDEKKSDDPDQQQSQPEQQPLATEQTENDPQTKEKAPERKKLGMNDDEVVAVLGHELGHWKLNHMVWNIIISEVNMFLCLAVFAFLYKQTVLYEAFGFTNSQPPLIGLVIIFEFVFAPYNEVVSFLMTCWSRRMEFQADDFSAKLGYSKLLISALIKLEKDNLTFPVDDWLYSAWHHSHPPVPERIAAMKKYD